MWFPASTDQLAGLVPAPAERILRSDGIVTFIKGWPAQAQAQSISVLWESILYCGNQFLYCGSNFCTVGINSVLRESISVLWNLAVLWESILYCGSRFLYRGNK